MSSDKPGECRVNKNNDLFISNAYTQSHGINRDIIIYVVRVIFPLDQCNLKEKWI